MSTTTGEELAHLRWRLSQTEDERDRCKQERDEFRDALLNLLREAGPYAARSKHLQQECEDAQRVLETTGE